MSVSALTNSFYNYVPVTSSQYETSSNKNVSNTQTQENIKATDEKQTQNQIISNSYKENNKYHILLVRKYLHQDQKKAVTLINSLQKKNKNK